MGARLWVKDVVKWTCPKCKAGPLEWCWADRLCGSRFHKARAVLENQPVLTKPEPPPGLDAC